jgi:SynChlorMet cassette protein ScmD
MNDGYSPIRNPVAVLREEFDDWAVLFNPDTAQAVGINPIGVSVWKLIDGNRTIKDMVAQIAETYEEVPDSAGDDIAAFIQNLTEGGFVGYAIEDMD